MSQAQSLVPSAWVTRFPFALQTDKPQADGRAESACYSGRSAMLERGREFGGNVFGFATGGGPEPTVGPY